MLIIRKNQPFYTFLLLFVLITTVSNAQVIVSDDFSNRSKFIDNTLLTLWGANSSPVSGFVLNNKTDNNGLAFNSVLLTSLASSNSGYTSSSSLKTLTSIDYELPTEIDRNLFDIKIEFDAIWSAQNGSGENGRLCVTLMDNYPTGGASFGYVDSVNVIHPFARPLYNIRIRNNSGAGNGPLLLYGAGTSTDPAWELYNTGPWWLPGFSVKSGGGSPSNAPFYPSGGSLRSTLVTTSTTIWKHYTWIIKKERMELYFRNSSQTEASNVLIFFMQIPKNTSDAYVISEINAAHGTNISVPPPYYNWYGMVKAVRFYWRGIENSNLANVSISTTPNSILSIKSSDLIVAEKNEALFVQWKDHSNDIKEYEIEYSVNGTDFTTIGKVPHVVNQVHYQYNKVMALRNINYIRIKSITDNQHGFTYSPVKKLVVSKNPQGNNISIFPNPVKDQIFFSGRENYNNCSIKIIDNKAALLINATCNNNALKVDKLKSGFYYFQVIKEGIFIGRGSFIKE